MSDGTAASSAEHPRLFERLGSSLTEIIGLWLLGRPDFGALTVTFPNGRSRTVGDIATGAHGILHIKKLGVIREAMKRGTVGFAASFIRGDIEVPDLTALFQFFVQNRSMFDRANPGLFRKAAQDFAYHLNRRNTREGAKRNISEHYDLGNDFYAEWLDPSMTYSSAVFRSGDQTLEAAQLEKYKHVADMAGVSDGAQVLEIGCGWGGFAETVGLHYNAGLTGITLSAEQLKFGRARIKAQGLQDRIVLKFEDYRDTKGTFDHVCSIEMIEAVGEDHWETYFQTVHDRLRPGGTAAIQAITIDERDFENYRTGPDFIQRYIFPGGMLLTKKVMKDQGARVGLILEQVENFRLSYAKTLQLWRERFLERWPAIAPLGYDEEFRRKWVYYLSYCEAGFREGAIDVGIYQYRRAD